MYFLGRSQYKLTKLGGQFLLERKGGRKTEEQVKREGKQHGGCVQGERKTA